MNKMEKALHELSEMDDLAAQDSPIHRLHPAAKLLATIAYILLVVSFDKYDLDGLFPMLLWPVLLFQLSGVPVRTCFYKLRIVLPLVMAVGLFNPFFDRAPLLMLGRWWREQGVEPTYLLGGRSKDLLLRLDAFREVGRVEVTTEDGSLGERCFVTDHSLLRHEEFSLIQTCGPTPMMKSVARYARQRGVRCEVSLENHMACGVGACLCCVTADREGHNRCVCTEGPVFPAELIMND